MVLVPESVYQLNGFQATKHRDDKKRMNSVSIVVAAFPVVGYFCTAMPLPCVHLSVVVLFFAVVFGTSDVTLEIVDYCFQQ